MHLDPKFPPYHLPSPFSHPSLSPSSSFSMLSPSPRTFLSSYSLFSTITYIHTSDAKRDNVRYVCSSKLSPAKSGPEHNPNDSHTWVPSGHNNKKVSWSKYSLVRQTFLTFQIPYIFDQTPRLLFFCLFVCLFVLLLILVQLLTKGGVSFIGKPADSNDSWIR